MPAPLRRPLLPLAMLAAFSLAVPSAAAEPSWPGEAHCRISPLQPTPRDGEVNWKGACVEGYASGKGVLAWRSDKRDNYSIEATLVRGDIAGEAVLKTPEYTYTGTLKSGLPHGEGYFAYADGYGWYEGDVVAGLPHGKGTRLQVDRTRYTGQWADGKRHGWGEATFALGGSYSGSWKDDKFDGQGKIVYAGRGHTYEGLFEDGRVAGLPAPEIDKGTYAVKRAMAWTRALKEDRFSSGIAMNSSWDDLTPAQKNRVRSQHPALEAGDEPPFPVKGEGALIADVARINQARRGGIEGYLDVYVLIGKDGAPLNVTTYGNADAAFARTISQVMMLHPYKPAVCRGEPCDMVYAKRFVFSLN